MYIKLERISLMVTFMPLWDPFKSQVYINGILEAMFNLAVPCNYKIKQLITSINIIHYQLSVPRIVFDTSWVALNESPMNEWNYYYTNDSRNASMFKCLKIHNFCTHLPNMYLLYGDLTQLYFLKANF